MRVSFDVVHDVDGAKLLGERVDCLEESSSEIGRQRARFGSEQGRLRQICRAKTNAFHFADPVQRYRNSDRMKPGRERRIATKLIETLEGANEGVLREILRQIAVARHAIHEAVNTVDMGVV